MIKVSAVLLVGLIVAALLRRQSAALRHWVLATAIACATVMPVAQWIAPAWQVRMPAFLTSHQNDAVTSSSQWKTEVSATGFSTGATGGPQTAVLPSLEQVWLVGMFASFALVLVGFGRLAWATARSRRVLEGTWFDTVTALSEGPKPRTPARLLQTDHPTLLVTWGLTRPKIMLPQAAREWPADRIRSVLGHELAHVERRDWAVQMLAEFLRCIYWFNPLVWIACHRLRQESEKACDDAVLNMGIEAPEYATHLLDVARAFRQTQSHRSVFPAPAMARPSHLERRVRVMLNKGSNHAPLTRLAGIAVAVGLLAVTVPIAGLVAASETSQAAVSQPDITATDRSAVGDRFLLAPSTPAGQTSETVVSLPPQAPRREETPAPVAAGSRASAQTATAEYSGTVTDQTGRQVFGAVARINGGPGGLTIEMKTGEDGKFSATGLPAGEYQLEVTKPGFMTIRKQVVLAAGQQLRENLAVQIGSLSEMIVIQGGGAATRPASPPVARQAGRPAAAAVDPCADVTTGGCLTPPMKLLDVKPVFPSAHATDGASGTIVVEARLDTDGFLKDMRVNDGADAAFAAAALEAIRQWQFSPVKLNGIPQECRVTVTAKFVAGAQ